jgi:hypothetical protein
MAGQPWGFSFRIAIKRYPAVGFPSKRVKNRHKPRPKQESRGENETKERHAGIIFLALSGRCRIDDLLVSW